MKKSAFIFISAFFSLIFFSCDEIGFNDDIVKDIELETSVTVNVTVNEDTVNYINFNFLWPKGKRLTRADIVKQFSSYTPGYDPKQIIYHDAGDDSTVYETGDYLYYQNYAAELKNETNVIINTLNWIIVQDKDIDLTVNGLIPRNDTSVKLRIMLENESCSNNSAPDYSDGDCYEDLHYAYGYTGEKVVDGLRLNTLREDLLYEPDLDNLVTNPDSIITPDSVIEIHYKRKKFPIKIVTDSTVQIYDSESNKELSPNTDGYYYYWSKFGVLASELVAAKQDYVFDHWETLDERLNTGGYVGSSSPYIYTAGECVWTPVFKYKGTTGSDTDSQVNIHIWETIPDILNSETNTYHISKSEDLKSFIDAHDADNYFIYLYCDYETDLSMTPSDFYGKTINFKGTNTGTTDSEKFKLVYKGSSSLFINSTNTSIGFENLELQAAGGVNFGAVNDGNVSFSQCRLNWQNGTCSMFSVYLGELSFDSCDFTGNSGEKPYCLGLFAEIYGGTVCFSGGSIENARTAIGSGAFFITDHGFLKLSNATVSKCEGSDSAVIKVIENGIAEIDNCAFSDCVSQDANYVLYTESSNCKILSSTLFDEDSYYNNSGTTASGETVIPPETVYVGDNNSLKIDGTMNTGTISLGTDSVIEILSNFDSESAKKMVVKLSDESYTALTDDPGYELPVFTGSDNLSLCSLANIYGYGGYSFTILGTGCVKLQSTNSNTAIPAS